MFCAVSCIRWLDTHLFSSADTIVLHQQSIRYLTAKLLYATKCQDLFYFQIKEENHGTNLLHICIPQTYIKDCTKYIKNIEK